jgi:hypothetical protein
VKLHALLLTLLHLLPHGPSAFAVTPCSLSKSDACSPDIREHYLQLALYVAEGSTQEFACGVSAQPQASLRTVRRPDITITGITHVRGTGWLQ